jgi:hypothetical protein
MLLQIVTHTPTWVFALLIALVALGVSQLRTRRVGTRRLLLTPLPLVALSMAGIASIAAAQPLAVPIWLAAAIATAAAIRASSPPAGTAYDAAARQFTLPGSATPLLLILGIFLVKYAAGVIGAMDPELARQAGFALPLSAVYGTLSGAIVGRMLRLWRLTGRTEAFALDLRSAQ